MEKKMSRELVGKVINATKAKQNKAILWYPSNHPVFHETIPKVRKAINDKPPAKPSKPSVKLTALLLARRTNNMNKP